MTDREHRPESWSDDRVREVLAHYEGQSEEEAAREDERVAEDREGVLMWIPSELADQVRALIARWRGNAA